MARQGVGRVGGGRGGRGWSRDKAWWRARIVGEVDGLGGIAVKGRGEKLFRLVQYCSLEVVGIFLD